MPSSTDGRALVCQLLGTTREVGNGLTEVSLQLAKGNEQLPDQAQTVPARVAELPALPNRCDAYLER